MAKYKQPVSVPVQPLTQRGCVVPTRENWTPVNGNVSIGTNDTVKTSGIKIRGVGAAIKGTMARGPMA